MDFSFERWLKQLLTEVFEDVFDNNPQPPPDDNDPAPTPPPDDDDDNNPPPDPEPTNYPWQNGRSLVFQDDFSNPGDTADKWIFNSTWSYPGAGPTNHPNGKLDHFSDAAITQSGGILTFTATPRSDGDWDTGLITTGDAEEPATFALKTGDFHVAHVQLPDDNNMGAWPALWTWNNGGNEIDSFEWHTDNPHLLELTNHVNGGGHYYVNDELVAPSKWVWIGTDFQAGNCTYYVGDSLDTLRAVYSDGTGVGNWEAYAIINLSIVDGTWHPAPTNDNPIVFRVSDYRVYR